MQDIHTYSYVCMYLLYRESAEQRVKELQFVLNETFKRFAINYDEEADEEDQFSDEAPEQTKL